MARRYRSVARYLLSLLLRFRPEGEEIPLL